jgi:hypothetical protein
MRKRQTNMTARNTKATKRTTSGTVSLTAEETTTFLHTMYVRSTACPKVKTMRCRPASNRRHGSRE